MPIFSKKRFTFSLLLFISFFSNAQDNVIEFNLVGKQKLVFNQTTSEGNSSVVIWDKTSKNESTEIFNYNSNLELRYKKVIKSDFKDNSGFFGGGTRRPTIFYDLLVSDDGEYVYSAEDEYIINGIGELKKYTSMRDNDYYNERAHLEFMSDNYFCHLGPKLEKTKKERKKTFYDSEYYLYTRNNNDLSKKAYALNDIYLGEIGKRNIKIARVFKDKFYTVTKDLNKNKTENQYTIVSYNYEGEKIAEVVIPLVLNKKFFMTSNNNGGDAMIYSMTSDVGGTSMTSTKHTLKQDSTGNIFVDEVNGAFYIYGLYTNKKDRDFYNANFAGFYVHKYSLKGELEWKQQRAIVDKNDFNKKSVAFFMNVNFFVGSDNKISLTIDKSNKSYFAHFFTMNIENGKIIKKKKINFEVDKVRLAGMKKNCAFPTGILIKNKFGKSNLDINSLLAANLSTRVNNYLLSKKSEELNYNATITEKGIYLIEENVNANKYQLLKFKW